MEVHKHPHHVAHKKKWPEYLLEFFMLFLAVFLGFIAENIRENIVENHREKEFVHLFIEDLHEDTSIIRRTVPQMRETIAGLDTLIRQTYLLVEGKSNNRALYYAYHHYCRSTFDVKLSDRTINQLRSSGSLRLIRNKESAEIISKIELGLQHLQEATRFVQTRQEDASNFGLRIFDFNEYRKANTLPDGTLDTRDQGLLQINYQPPVNVSDAVYLKEFAARVGYLRNALYDFSLVLERSIPLIQKDAEILQKNYHMD